jgi:hypothetical protein
VKRNVSNSELPFKVPFVTGRGAIPFTPPPKVKFITIVDRYVYIISNNLKKLLRISFYFLEGNLLSRTRFTPQDAAPPITPPATARPRKTAPATTIGATFASGATIIACDDEKSIIIQIRLYFIKLLLFI